MDETLYLACSALLISIVVWILNPLGKLHKLLSFLLQTHDGGDQHAKLSEGVRSFDEIPGPKGLPYFGNLTKFLKMSDFKTMTNDLKSSFEQCGPIFKWTVLGKTFVWIQDPRDVEAVYKTEGRHPLRPGIDDQTKPEQMYRKSRNLPLNMLALNGKDWSRVRKALAPKMLRPKDIRGNLDNFNEVARDTIDHMLAVRGADDVIPDLEEELVKWATESVGTMAFDVRVGLYDDPPKKETVKLVKANSERAKLGGKLSRGWMNLLFKMLRWAPSYSKFCEAQDTLFGISQEIVDKKIAELKNAAEQGEGFQDNTAMPLLTHLIMKGELTPKEINVNSITMFRAGVETTSTGMIWLLYDLARNPEVQEKVYEEVISQVGPHGDFTPESFAKLVYVKACLKESMRLHPVVHLWGRIQTEDVVLSGYKVPSGTSVVYPNYLSGRSEKLFKFPLEFKPERWLNDDLGKIHPFAVLPFGVGSRMCLGRRIAETEIFLLASKLVQRFRLEYHEDPVEMKLRILAVPDRPIKIKFIDRE